MEYMDLIRAREGLSILQTAKFPISQLKTMRTIYRMNNEIADAMRFLADEERKIISKYGGSERRRKNCVPAGRRSYRQSGADF